MKRVSVVILNWNGKKLLERFLPSVVENTSSEVADIVVADNFSTDDSIAFLEKEYPDISLISLSENYGFAEGYNRALSQVSTEYYVLLNSDVEVSENWLGPIIDFLDQNEDIAAVQPKVLSQRNKSLFEYAGACGGFIDKFGYPFCRGRLFDTVEEDRHQYEKPIPVFWATGACMVIRSKDYNGVGGLDGNFFAHMEEIDLCWRLNARGRKIYCLPQSVVYHVGGATLDIESPRKTFLNFRNNMLMLYKNIDSKNFQKVYYARIFLDYLAALQMMCTGKWKTAKAIVEARYAFKKIRKSYKDVRTQNLVKQTNLNINTIYSKSILWRYYIKGQKIFSKLNFDF